MVINEKSGFWRICTYEPEMKVWYNLDFCSDLQLLPTFENKVLSNQVLEVEPFLVEALRHRKGLPFVQ